MITGATLPLTLAFTLPPKKSSSMAQLLLKLDVWELVDALWDSDPMGVKTAINHMIIDGGKYYVDVETISPIHSAIVLGDADLAVKLVNGGADVHINFGAWLEAAKTSPDQRANVATDEKKKEIFFNSVEQPLATAIRSGAPNVAMHLLACGACPNTYAWRVERMIDNVCYRPYLHGRLALDMVQCTLERLREYPNARDLRLVMNKPTKPIKAYDLERDKHLKGAANKKATINKLISDYEALEKAIIDRGGVTFAQQHPGVETGSEAYSWQPKDDGKPEFYKYSFSFIKDKGMTEIRKNGYVQLMEAAWANDGEKVQDLTLQAWGPNKDQPPLKAAIPDGSSNTPFSIAFLRGHYQTAWIILGIIKAQWSAPKKKDQRRPNSGKPRITFEKNNHFSTIDNIGQVSLRFKSHVTPLDPRSLITHLLDVGDGFGLSTLLEMAQHFSRQQQGGSEEIPLMFKFPLPIFYWVVENGKIDVLPKIMSEFGAGIPFDEFRRQDWATASRNGSQRLTGLNVTPLLHAALGGSMKSIKFFLGDAPRQLYAEFSASTVGQRDLQLELLEHTTGGLKRAITEWLAADADLVIYFAILATPSERTNAILEYLIDTTPGAIEKKNANGDTPLLVACRLGRMNYVRILIKANANLLARNLKGENILHAALYQQPKAHQLQPLLDLLDADLRNYLFLQRKNLAQNGNTPLHVWLKKASGYCEPSVDEERFSYYRSNNMPPPRLYYKNTDAVDMLKLLLGYSNLEDL
ncbi:ankyrin repeat-containing domain protein [Mariannaea sp. PMI_226]|nr:ankyrin repeat-containing domain protein [Mariannaea sp. PMI_226]